MVAFVACGARTELSTPRDGSVDASNDSSRDDCGASLASGPSWTTPFGPAQHVCLTTTSPQYCPSDALYVGHGGGWSADLSQLGGAAWIWRPGFSVSDPADLVQVVFTRKLVLRGVPSATIGIAADDFAEVDVNGVKVGSVGSVTDVSVASAGQSVVTVFDLSARLVAGENTITVVARNGPAWFGGCGGGCSYVENPAGVVFGGRVECR